MFSSNFQKFEQIHQVGGRYTLPGPYFVVFGKRSEEVCELFQQPHQFLILHKKDAEEER